MLTALQASPCFHHLHAPALKGTARFDEGVMDLVAPLRGRAIMRA